jgi:hypothetical protein
MALGVVHSVFIGCTPTPIEGRTPSLPGRLQHPTPSQTVYAVSRPCVSHHPAGFHSSRGNLALLGTDLLMDQAHACPPPPPAASWLVLE